jgi:uncharacterized protein
MRILVVAKAPRPGHVKTRLCPPCSPEQAAAIAEAAVADTLDAALATGLPVVVALDGPPGTVFARRYVTIVEQRGATFNERLENAWAHLRGGGVQIGTDTPQLTARDLIEAAAQVEREGAALGLAADGGRWALGLRMPLPGAFAGVPMSRATTGAAQRMRLVALGAPPAMLPVRSDVDTWDDALAVAALAPHTRFADRVTSIGAELEQIR